MVDYSRVAHLEGLRVDVCADWLITVGVAHLEGLRVDVCADWLITVCVAHLEGLQVDVSADWLITVGVAHLEGLQVDMCADWLITVGVAHLEGLQVLSNISQNNVREALSQFDRETRQNIDARLAGIEAAFDLGYLQAEEGLS